MGIVVKDNGVKITQVKPRVLDLSDNGRQMMDRIFGIFSSSETPSSYSSEASRTWKGLFVFNT
jgi:hypothetical protein